MEIPFTEEEYENGRRDEMVERAFQEAMAAFKRKTDRIQATAMPIIKQVYENQGAMYGAHHGAYHRRQAYVQHRMQPG